jgi:PRTRC genetic system protein A
LQSGFVAIPCGELSPSVNLAFGTFPVWILEQFTEQAVRHQPVETGAVAVWNSVQKTLRYAECESVEAGIGHLRARWPTLGADESIAIDMHSHGPISAYFSSVDRKDMGSDVVVACVVGKTDQQTPQVVVSLFVCGLELRVPVPGHKQPGQNDEPSFQSLCEGIF